MADGFIENSMMSTTVTFDYFSKPVFIHKNEHGSVRKETNMQITKPKAYINFLFFLVYQYIKPFQLK